MFFYSQGMPFYPGSSCSFVSIKFYWRTSSSKLVIQRGMKNLHSRLAIVVHWPQLSPKGNCLTQCKYLVCSPYSWVILCLYITLFFYLFFIHSELLLLKKNQKIKRSFHPVVIMVIKVSSDVFGAVQMHPGNCQFLATVQM